MNSGSLGKRGVCSSLLPNGGGLRRGLTQRLLVGSITENGLEKNKGKIKRKKGRREGKEGGREEIDYNQDGGDPWVAQQFNACLWPRA